MNVSPGGYALVGLTAIVAGLVAVLAFAALRFAAAARDTGRHARSSRAETALLSAALQEAVGRLKAQERATAARAEASERLSGEIISSLTAGLLVVGLEGEIKILNPAGRVCSSFPTSRPRCLLDDRHANRPLMDVIDDCLRTRTPIVRRVLVLSEIGRGVHLGVTVSPLFDGEGQLHGAICLFTDLTAVKDLEEQLRLKDSLAAVGELTAGIAHEFRNGLATIHGYSKLFDLAGAARGYPPVIQGRHPRRDRVAQPGGDQLPELRAPGAAHARARRSATDLRARGRRDPRRRGPARRRRRGSRRVRRRRRRRGAVASGVQQSSAQRLRGLRRRRSRPARPRAIGARSLAARRPDRRAGQRAGYRARLGASVFRPFFTTKRNGTGLGLALVQKIVVFHNGRIIAASSPGRGAPLQITLPLSADGAAWTLELRNRQTSLRTVTGRATSPASNLSDKSNVSR